MNFWEKSENVIFLHSLRLSFMPNIRKIYREVFREKRGRQRERDRERETDPNIRVLRTLSLSRRTKKNAYLSRSYSSSCMWNTETELIGENFHQFLDQSGLSTSTRSRENDRSQVWHLFFKNIIHCLFFICTSNNYNQVIYWMECRTSFFILLSVLLYWISSDNDGCVFSN